MDKFPTKNKNLPSLPSTMSWISNPIKAYLTSTLQAALSQYVLNVDLEALGLLGSSGIVARDVELRLDWLDKRLDLASSRGFVKELRINIPWTALLSQPIEIELRTVEVVLIAGHAPEAFHPKTDLSGGDAAELAEGGAARASLEGEESSWIRQTLKSILANATLEIHNVIIKYQRDDVILSTSLKSLTRASCDPQTFENASQKPMGPFSAMYKVCNLFGLTVTLDRMDQSLQRITAFQVPVLQRTDARARICMHLEPGQGAQPQVQSVPPSHPDVSADPFARALPDPWGHPNASLVALCDVWIEKLVLQLSEQHVQMLDDLAHRPRKLVFNASETPEKPLSNATAGPKTSVSPAPPSTSWRSWAWDVVAGSVCFFFSRPACSFFQKSHRKN